MGKGRGGRGKGEEKGANPQPERHVESEVDAGKAEVPCVEDDDGDDEGTML